MRKYALLSERCNIKVMQNLSDLQYTNLVKLSKLDKVGLVTSLIISLFHASGAALRNTDKIYLMPAL